MEDKIRQGEHLLTELEKKHQGNVERILSENNFRVRELVRDWENRIQAVSERSRMLDQENKGLEDEFRSLSERFVQLQITYDQELRDLGRRVEEEEYNKFNSISITLESKIAAMQEGREMVIKRNAEGAQYYDKKEREEKEKVGTVFDELEKLKGENEGLSVQNKDYRNNCEQLKNKGKISENNVEKIEKEINSLNEQVELKRKMQADQLAGVLREQRSDRAIWEVRANRSLW